MSPSEFRGLEVAPGPRRRARPPPSAGCAAARSQARPASRCSRPARRRPTTPTRSPRRPTTRRRKSSPAPSHQEHYRAVLRSKAAGSAAPRLATPSAVVTATGFDSFHDRPASSYEALTLARRRGPRVELERQHQAAARKLHEAAVAGEAELGLHVHQAPRCEALLSGTLGCSRLVIESPPRREAASGKTAMSPSRGQACCEALPGSRGRVTSPTLGAPEGITPLLVEPLVRDTRQLQ